VAKPAEKQKPMTADKEPGVTAPLTDGFSRTSYEQDVARTQAEEAKHPQ
jgi:hypothetical protein